MLEKLKALSSRVNSRGAGARLLKQSRDTEEHKPEVVNPRSAEELKVLAYLRETQGGIVSHDDIARGSGVAKYKIGTVVSGLVKDGLVEKARVPREGTRYQIIGGGPNSSKVTEESSVTDDSEQNEIDFVKTSEDLIFRFVRATRSTDVLIYLTWLERGGK